MQTDELPLLGDSLDALLAFADRNMDFALAATLDSARLQFIQLYGNKKG
jgi:hypothetical protein